MRPRRALIVGAAGQVGLELQRSFVGFGEVIACDRETADLRYPDQLDNLIEQARPTVVLLSAAYTAVDKAETEQDLAMAINSVAPGVLARACARHNALLVSYSTDYVFDGWKDGAWTEEDTPRPLNVYGQSKLAGEHAIEQAGGKHLVLRTSWVYGPHGRNFYLTMLRLAKDKEELGIVCDQVGGPTSSIAIADATRRLVDRALDFEEAELRALSGVYHFTCGGRLSWFEFAEAIFDASRHLTGGRRPALKPLRTEEYPTAAARPRNSVLSNEKLRSTFEVSLPDWQDAFERVQHRMSAPAIV